MGCLSVFALFRDSHSRRDFHRFDLTHRLGVIAIGLAILLGTSTSLIGQELAGGQTQGVSSNPILDFTAGTYDYRRPTLSQTLAPTMLATPQEAEKSVEERLAAVEAELTKAKEAEKKKKEQDAAKPSVKLRGRLHTDANWFHQSAANMAAVGDIEDGVYIRRARIGWDASAFEVTQYRFEFDIGAGRHSIQDAYGRVTHLPYMQNFQLGHFREPLSLDALTSSNYNVFIERSYNNDIDQGRNWGIMAFGASESENVTWAVGGFRTGTDGLGADIGDRGGRAVTSRWTWTPYFDEPTDGRYFYEVGASYSFRTPDREIGGTEDAIVEFGSRPEDNLVEAGVGGVPKFIEIEVPDALDIQLFGFESTWNIGSLNLQSEYVAALVDREAAPTLYYHAAYVQASYYLTGEHRQWERSQGTFGATSIFEPFFRVRTEDGKICNGWGAWEIAARWNYLSLIDDDLNGGYLDNTTVGLNWYLSSYMRFMFDYNLADLHSPTDGRSNASIFNMRMDVHF